MEYNDLTCLKIYVIYIFPNSFVHRNAYKVKKNCKLNNLQNTVAATKSFAAISQKKTKIKASYYERKLLLLEKIAAAEEKKAEALMSIAQSLASRQNL